MNAKDLEVWTAQSLCNIGILLSVTTFALHLAHPYFERTVRQLQAKMAEEMWWLLYIFARDATLLVSVLCGFLMMNPDLMADIKIGLPFVPFATVLMTGAIVVKLVNAGKKDGRAHRLVTALLTAAAALNTFGYTFVMEAPGKEYAHAQSAFWQAMVNMRSNRNPELAIWTFYLSFVLLFAVVMALLVMLARQQPLVEESPLPRRRTAAPQSEHPLEDYVVER